MVLESLSQEKNNSRIIYIIRPSAQKDVFKLGRGHESDLRINDISVSRCHAKIKLENGKFLLEDNQSKFGTLVLVKQRTPLLPNYNKAVQVGRTVINFSVKPQNNQSSVQNNAAAVRLKPRLPGFPNQLSERNPLLQDGASNENNDDDLANDCQRLVGQRSRPDINGDYEEQQNVHQALFNNNNVYMPAWNHQDMAAATIVLPSIATIQSGNYIPE